MHTTPAIMSRAVVMAFSTEALHYSFEADACGFFIHISHSYGKRVAPTKTLDMGGGLD